jgi:hypothetical protein
MLASPLDLARAPRPRPLSVMCWYIADTCADLETVFALHAAGRARARLVLMPTGQPTASDQGDVGPA